MSSLAPAPPALTARPLADQVFSVVDVETSGLSSRRHRILQVAVVTVRGDGTVIDTWSSPVRPALARVGLGRVGPTHIHGLRSRDLRQAPLWAQVAPRLVERLDGTVLVAHNARFDWSFVRRGLVRAGYHPPDAARLCTMRASRSLDPERLESHRLPDVCARYGIAIARPHDALADAEATAALLPRLAVTLDATALEDLAPFVDGHATRWPPPVPPTWHARLRGRVQARRHTRRPRFASARRIGPAPEPRPPALPL
jgi:DNA polymerase-3 subunit epsilon